MLADEWRAGRGLARGALVLRAFLDLFWTAVIERIGGSGTPRETRPGVNVRRLGISWLDFKLGIRLLVKYPGLTVVGGLAMAFAIWVGAWAFAFVTQVAYPRLPLPDGDRIVGIRLWNTMSRGVHSQVLHDFVTWRQGLESVEDVGTFRSLERSLIVPDGPIGSVDVAEISASAFRVARVPPLLGRTLVDADEVPGAPGVVVIGHDLWQTRFGADPGVVGREVRLGRGVHTVVGVMPEGFGFPWAHSAWIPLRLDTADYPRGSGPALEVFGRLRPGTTLEQAQAEATTIGQRTAAAFPHTHEHLRPQVMPYAKSTMRLPTSSLALLSTSAAVVVALLLVLICANVALLLFARATARENEIVVRNALGASRGRIIGQLFAEALVLACLSAVIGLAAAGGGLNWVLGTAETEFGAELPFWFHGGISPGTVLFAAALTFLAAVIAGVGPGLKVSRGLAARLRQRTAGGGGFRFGGVWTVVIAAQVAVTVAFPVVTFFELRDIRQLADVVVGFPEEEYLALRVEMDPEDQLAEAADESPAGFLARYRATVEELKRRVDDESAVIGVTIADRLPRMYHPQRHIEVDGGAAQPDTGRSRPGYRVSSASVALEYFDLLEAPILMGRGFHFADIASGARPIIVNESFVENVLGGRNPIGRRIRYMEERRGPVDEREEQEPWYEIVGVVRDLALASTGDSKVAGFYHPLWSNAALGNASVSMAVRVSGDPTSFAPRLLTIAAALDPALHIDNVMRIDELDDAQLEFYGFWFRLSVLVCLVALLLSLAGIYAVISFTVSQRMREIGIRVALGAERRSIALAILRRPLTPVGIGVVAGAALAASLVQMVTGLTAATAPLVAAYAGLMLGVCMLACVVPTRRALGIQPAEVLKDDA